MKRTVAFLLLLCLGLAACGSPSHTDTPEPGFTFTYNGVEMAINANAAGILPQLGTPKSYTEEASCAFDGMDKTYYFGSFYLTTYPMEGKDYIYSIWFADDSVATEEGIYIGASKEAVANAYGAECFNGTNAFIIEKGKTKLTIVLTEGTVSSVLYETVIE